MSSIRMNKRISSMNEAGGRAFIVEHLGFQGKLCSGAAPRLLCEPATRIDKSGLGGYGVFAGAPLLRDGIVMAMCCPKRYSSLGSAQSALWSKGQRWDLQVSHKPQGPFIIDAGMPDLTGLLVNKDLVEAKHEEPQYLWDSINSLTDLFVFSHWAFANHSSEPNCKMLIHGATNDSVTVEWVALRDIKEGEELTYYYGKHPEEWCQLFKRGQACTGCVAPKRSWNVMGQTRNQARLLSELAARLDSVQDMELAQFLEEPSLA